MPKRPLSSLDSTLALLIKAMGRFTRRPFPALPANRSIGGPVVFRHYL